MLHERVLVPELSLTADFVCTDSPAKLHFVDTDSPAKLHFVDTDSPAKLNSVLLQR